MFLFRIQCEEVNDDVLVQEVDDELRKAGKSEAEIGSIGPHKVFKVCIYFDNIILA